MSAATAHESASRWRRLRRRPGPDTLLPLRRSASRGHHEVGDVLLHPVQGGDLVEQTAVEASFVVVAGPAETVATEAVGDVDRDDAVAVGRPTVVPGTRGTAEDVHPAMDPYQDREFPIPVTGGGAKTLRLRISSPGMLGSGMVRGHSGIRHDTDPTDGLLPAGPPRSSGVRVPQ